MLGKQLKDFLSPRVFGVSPDAPVRDALKVMRSANISCILVLDAQRPVGILTERTILLTAARQGASFMDSPVSGVMSGPLLTATGDMFLYEAYNLLTTQRYRHLVIVDAMGFAVGVVTMSDLISRLGMECFAHVKNLAAIMTRDVETLPATALVREALTLMAGQGLSCLVVTQEGMPEGIVSERDVTSLMLGSQDLETLALADIMSSPVLSVPPDLPVHEAAEIMRRNGFRRLVVTNDNHELLGLVTQSDIVRGLEGSYVDTLRRILEEKESRLQDIGRDLAQKELFLEHILHSSTHMGIAATDTDFMITYFNPSAEKMLGLPSAQVVGRNAKDFHSGPDNILHNKMDEVAALIRDEGPGSGHIFGFEHGDPAEERHIQARISGIWDGSSLLVGFVLMLNDITDQKKAEDTIRHMAYHDMLTGLPNRLLFNDRLELELARAARNRHPLALMALDLDRFKEVNDTMGHQAGDHLLKELGRRFNLLLRQSDTVARFGGDEFVFLLPEVGDTEDLLSVAEKILDAVSEPFIISGKEVAISGSVGGAVFPQDGDNSDILVRNADRAMYAAKEHGRNGGGAVLYLYNQATPLPLALSEP
ncbi:MAG: diguanylate cyclase [Desulfovibrio sp.]|nr:MAG: diguanylate cyclase [Desulfovibrio sp.]